MLIAEQIRQRLQEVLAPQALEIIDESEKHRGHAGWREGGQSHFALRISAAALADKSRIEAHRAIHNAIGADLMARIHALSIRIE